MSRRACRRGSPPHLAFMALGFGLASSSGIHAWADAAAPQAGTRDATIDVDAGDVTAFVGATVWDGTAGPAIVDAVLLVEGGRVRAIGPSAAVEIPTEARQVDLAGRWVVPGLINAHGHVGAADGLDSGDAAHTRENIARQLALYARYGITTVVSLDEPGYLGVEFTREQDRPDLDRARLFVSGRYMDPASPDEVAAQLRERLEAGVAWGKIRVDDQLGRTQRMDPPTYAEVITQAQAADLPVTAHVVYLRDAHGLVAAGVDVLGHSVRDAAVDEELVSAMLERDVCLHPTLTREVSTYIYRERPAFFDDPFFLRDADPSVVAALEQPERQARYTGEAADWYRDALPTATRNMVRLHQAGVRIAFGTDSGPPARFQGYFEHMELEMMQAAGMAAPDVLASATRIASECMQLADVGQLHEGAWADFVVLRADPLLDVRNLRQIEEVRIAGNPVEGAHFSGE